MNPGDNQGEQLCEGEQLCAVILTEAGPKTGFGHLSRCIALYEAFESLGATPRLVVAGDIQDERLEGVRHERGDWAASANAARRAADADVVVIDSYLASRDCYQAAEAAAGTLVSMDDTLRLDYPSGLVVNGAPDAEDLPYPDAPGVEYLLGPRYAPLRPSFWNVPAKDISPLAEKALVTLGSSGSAAELSAQVATSLLAFGLQVRVAGAYRPTEAHTRKPIAVLGPLSAEDMLDEMLGADFCVAGGGQTLVELARVGTPTIAILVAENQRRNVEGWTRRGFAICAGEAADADLRQHLEAAVETLADPAERRRRSDAGRAAIDGEGALRVARRSLGRALVARLTIRKAAAGDARDVFAIANDPEVRRLSFHPQPIPWALHKAWFEARVSDPSCLLLLAREGPTLAGYVRFDIEGDAATVSIALAHGYRGRGLGAALLDHATEHLRRARPLLARARAYVKPGNRASKLAFESAGFVLTKTTTVAGQQAEVYERTLTPVSRQGLRRGHHR